MPNIQNLRPGEHKLTVEEAKKGGINSGKARRARKTLKETLLMMLEEGNTQDNITVALIEKAMSGDTRAFEVIRDSIGEKPVEKTDVKADTDFNVNIQVIK